VQGFRYGMPVAMGEVPALVRTRGTPPRTISAFSI
jgi:hypothetical protein